MRYRGDPLDHGSPYFSRSVSSWRSNARSPITLRSSRKPRRPRPSTSSPWASPARSGRRSNSSAWASMNRPWRHSSSLSPTKTLPPMPSAQSCVPTGSSSPALPDSMTHRGGGGWPIRRRPEGILGIPVSAAGARVRRHSGGRPSRARRASRRTARGCPRGCGRPPARRLGRYVERARLSRRVICLSGVPVRAAATPRRPSSCGVGNSPTACVRHN